MANTMNAAGQDKADRPTIDQARGALSWILGHWIKDGGSTSHDMGQEYEYAREILGEDLVDELMEALGNPEPKGYIADRVWQSGPLFGPEDTALAVLATQPPGDTVQASAGIGYRYSGPLRAGQVATAEDDLARLDAMIAAAPTEYPGLPLIRRHRDEVRALLGTDATPDTEET